MKHGDVGGELAFFFGFWSRCEPNVSAECDGKDQENGNRKNKIFLTTKTTSLGTEC